MRVACRLQYLYELVYFFHVDISLKLRKNSASVKDSRHTEPELHFLFAKIKPIPTPPFSRGVEVHPQFGPKSPPRWRQEPHRQSPHETCHAELDQRRRILGRHGGDLDQNVWWSMDVNGQ